MNTFSEKICFRKLVAIRFRKEQFEAIEELLEKYPEKYSSFSHIVRCAIIQLLNDAREQEEKEYANKRDKGLRKR